MTRKPEERHVGGPPKEHQLRRDVHSTRMPSKGHPAEEALHTRDRIPPARVNPSTAPAALVPASDGQGREEGGEGDQYRLPALAPTA